ncbi:hypothetical protein [Dactylosporangium sp. NPDC049140]|jgi:hypothetical protein|uniref:hypothetical protein n=1 Tax=Dactylosporangium sp. NPDC049140 TaxID=3155647 RepID=UPI00340A6423
MFLDAVFEFPTFLFTFLLALVVLYWVAVLFGGADIEAFEAVDIGLGGMPVTVAVSVVVTVGWFVSLAAMTVLGGPVLGGVVLLAALFAGLLAVLPLRRLFPTTTGDSRTAFVGRTCVIRTGTVTETFGQAEVTAADGSSAIVQVRQTGADSFSAGSPAVIYEYDQNGEFFWVIPHPGQRETS